MEDHPFTAPEGATVTSAERMEGVRYVFTMPNGYGASVIRSPYSYGGSEGFWEVAVLARDGSLDYSTPITSDVEGWQSDEDVSGLLARIAALTVPVVTA